MYRPSVGLVPVSYPRASAVPPFVEEAAQDLRETARPFEPGRVTAVGDGCQPAPLETRYRISGVVDR